MTATKTHLDSKRVGLAAAFSEPVYERLRYWDSGQEMQFLAFVRPLSEDLRTYLMRIGARPSERFEADCYAELWELSPLWIEKPRVTLTELDWCIASGLEFMGGKYSSAAGHWFHGASGSTDDRPHAVSHLLSLSARYRRSGNVR